jgi:hypothetical protein
MTARWRKFEREVASYFEAAGFQVELNAKAARPRQTDVFAHDDKLKVLIEVKDRKQAISVGDVAALRDRLNRMRPDVVGAIFSTSELSRGAKSEIEIDRTREIVTFIGKEIDLLRGSRQNIRSLIEQKRRVLLLDGKVWQCSERSSRFLGVLLPPGDVSFQIGKTKSAFFESRTRFSGVSCALDIHDTSWGSVSGEGARLRIRVNLHDVEGLRDLMGYLHKTFGLSRNGMFFIHQSESSWHGVGARQFIDTVRDWRERYAASPAKKFHHSEEVGYYDSFYTGWIHVSAQQRTWIDDPKQRSFMHLAEIVIQLPGLPLDTSRLSSLCEYADDSWAHFNYIAEPWTRSHRLKVKRRLDVVGRVMKPDMGLNGEETLNSVVIGVVARNPFYRKASVPKELREPDRISASRLVENELLLCSLRDWHDDGSEPDYYFLEGVEITEGATGPILRPYGTWNRMRKARYGTRRKLRSRRKE